MKYKKDDELICLTTTRPDGSVYKCFYVYDTAAAFSYYDGHGKPQPNVVKTREPWDGVSYIIKDNGD